MDDLNIQHEDVYMRLFIQSLEGEPRKSFRSLVVASINSWEMLENWFNIAWGEKKDYQYYLLEFAALKKIDIENVENIFKRFNKFYNKLPLNIKPLEAAQWYTIQGHSRMSFSL